MLYIFIFGLVLKHTGLLLFDTDEKSHTAHDMNMIINNGTLVKADPHLTVRGCSCKSLQGGGWMGTGCRGEEELRYRWSKWLFNYTILTGGDFASTFLWTGRRGSLEQSQNQACSC